MFACKHTLDKVKTFTDTRHSYFGITVPSLQQNSHFDYASAFLIEIHFTHDFCPSYIEYNKRKMSLLYLN